MLYSIHMNGLLLLKLIASTCVHMCVCKCASLINFPYPLKSNPHSVIDYICLLIIYLYDNELLHLLKEWIFYTKILHGIRMNGLLLFKLISSTCV